ncbi:hypothetical protein BDZ45DRAFT_670855 [Acephala macrosclerotiorum]|nr:hypothetical protein BDZ45DRAFT_670855 [Acephala macrosclerotiorum]
MHIRQPISAHLRPTTTSQQTCSSSLTQPHRNTIRKSKSALHSQSPQQSNPLANTNTPKHRPREDRSSSGESTYEGAFVYRH